MSFLKPEYELSFTRLIFFHTIVTREHKLCNLLIWIMLLYVFFSSTEEAIIVVSKQTSSKISFIGVDPSLSVTVVLLHTGGPNVLSPLLLHFSH